MPLALACVLLDAESSGGKNVFGEPKNCGPARGSEVTEARYKAYLAARDVCGAQGVGPLQLTWIPLQQMADEQGGCWRVEINVRVGLTEFARLLARYSVQDALSAWNTGKPGNSPYATKALGLLPGWQKVIDG